LSDQALWSGSATLDAAPMFAGNPVEAAFSSAAGRLRSGGRYETQAAGFSTAWLEFEDLLALAASRRRRMRAAASGVGPGAEEAAPATPPTAPGDASDDEVAPATPVRLRTPAARTPLPKEPEEESEELAEQRREVERLEGMIQEAQQRYEATIRRHLQKIQHESLDTDTKKFPQLYANVRKWQEQLEPLLSEEAKRPEFDIHSYSTKMLSKMSGMPKEAGPLPPVPFATLVQGQPRWEVCRRFLTALLLTNQGNTDIIFGSEEERLNNFKVQLLKAEKEWISLEGDEAQEKVPLPASGRAKKAAKQSAHAAAPEAGQPQATSSDARKRRGKGGA